MCSGPPVILKLTALLAFGILNRNWDSRMHKIHYLYVRAVYLKI